MVRSTDPTSSEEKTWFIVMTVFIVIPFVFGFLCLIRFLNPASRHISPYLTWLSPLFAILGLMALIACVLRLRLKVDGKIGDTNSPAQLTRGEFYSETVISLIASTGCAYLGLWLFFVGGTIGEFSLFAFGTLFVDLAFILPRGRKFWSNQK